MKKQLLNLKAWCVMLMLMVSGVALADTATLTFTKGCGGSGTDDQGNTWTVTSDAVESVYDGTKGIHYGTGKVAVSHLTLTTSGIEGTISEIKVNASGASKTSAVLDVTVGGSAFGSQYSLTSDATEYTFEGSASGEIVVKASQTSEGKALYVKSITVTYSTGGTQKTATVTSFGEEAQSSYTVYTTDEFTAPTATVTGGEGLVPTYTSSKEEVATVDAETGAVTIVAAGTTVIKATYEGDETYAASNASYTLIVKEPVKVYASLEELVAADIASGTEVQVTLTDVAIKSFFVTASGSYKNGVYFDIQKADKDIMIFCKNVPESWVIGGTLSGTLTCSWTLYSGTWELCPDKWDYLTYEAPANAKNNATLTATGYKTTMTEGDNASFDITYNGDATVEVSSSNEAVATVSIEGTTVTVNAVKAGTAIITISAAETENYYEAEKTFNLTVNAPAEPASLPFAFDNGVSAIDTTTGMTQSGLGSDYTNSPKLKFDSTGDAVIINFNEAAKYVEYTIKGNSFSEGTFDVQESADGSEYTTVKTYTALSDATVEKYNLKSDSRYVKFVYTTKSNGNVALGKISIVAASYVEDPALAFEKATYRFITTDEDMAVKAVSGKGSEGAITYSVSDENILIDENTGDIVCETAGTYTITATIAAAEGYTAGEATCTVTIIEPLVANYAIVGKSTENAYAMTTTWNSSKYYESKQIYAVGETGKYIANSKEGLLWAVSNEESAYTIQNPLTAEYVTGKDKNVSYADTVYTWTMNEAGYLVTADATPKPLLCNVSSPRFKTYDNASATCVLAEIIPAENLVSGYVRTVEKNAYGTICLPYAVEEFAGAEFYSIESINAQTGLITLSEAKTTLEAGKPYIFKANATTLACIYTGEAVEAPATDDYLMGTFEATDALEGSYVLQKQNSEYGFYKVGAEVIPTIGANRACLVVENSNVKAFTFGGNATAISGINAAQVANNTIYNIAGQRMNKAQKGIFIMNGKKVVK